MTQKSRNFVILRTNPSLTVMSAGKIHRNSWKKSPGASTTPEVFIFFGVWLLRRAKKNRFDYFQISNWPNWDEFQLQGLITFRRLVLQ